MLIDFTSLASLLLDPDLKFADKRVKFFNLPIFVLKLALQCPIVLGLFLFRGLFKSRLQLIDLLEGIPDLDLILGVYDLPQAFHLLTEVFSWSDNGRLNLHLLLLLMFSSLFRRIDGGRLFWLL